MEADIKEKYNGLLNYFNIKQTVFREQIKTKIYVSRTKLENLVIFVKNILDRVRLYNDIPELGSKETDEQPGEGLKIWTPNQMLSRLQISLAQLKAKKIQKNLKIKSDDYCILCTDQKDLQNKSIKVWLTLFKDETITMSTENSKTSESHIFRFDLTDKPNLKDPKKTWL